jgi:eukaryotic-like serine/threonine-protein kinase
LEQSDHYRLVCLISIALHHPNSLEWASLQNCFLLHCTVVGVEDRFMIGKTLGHYQVTSRIGKGGMGEVFQAKDQKLARNVAIKVLPEEFARDADRVARFQREAKLLASLNHANIAAIYGLEESGGTNFLVLELIEGETLAERLKRGLIPVDESLKLALQIADALEAAHEKGIIHRDLKPSNIKVTPDGKVKVLDFGLAKAYAGEKEEVNLSNSPTLSDAATQQGVILGTAAYMSPEQARGKTVDKRADIWAFGCVLYEMLTGQAAFQGEDITEILAAVVKGGADMDLLPANLHFRVREVIIRCLQKDQKRRYSGITDARYELEQTLTDPSGVLGQPITAIKPRKKLRVGIAWVAAALAFGLVIAGIAVWKLKPSEPRQVLRFEYELPEGQQLSTNILPALAVSPDGKQFVYSTTNGLYIRSVDELTAKLIAGTEGRTTQPFFSPDGKSIGYFSVADRQLKKIAVSGGAPVTLCAVAQLMGAWWSADNTIVYGQLPGDMMRISANGGTPQSLVKTKAEFPVFPQILPDGESVLYTSATSLTQFRVMMQSPKLKAPKELFAGGLARYLPTGHIVYILPNNSTLFAIAFDPDKLEVKGGPVPVIEGNQLFAVSDTGTLVYIPAATSGATQPGKVLVWVDRDGKEEILHAPSDNYRWPVVSPDGKRVALSRGGDKTEQIWIWDLIRETMTPLTTGKESNYRSIWTRDGKRIVFVSSRDNKYGLYWKAADGTGEEEKLSSTQNMLNPFSWSSDGKILVLAEISPDLRDADIGTLSMEGDHPIKTLLREEYVQHQPAISPDGKYMAYMSAESGDMEVYVRPFPEVNKGKWPISTGGGESPLWSPDGRELFYRNGSAVMAVAVNTKPTFSAGKPKMLFQGTYATGYNDSPAWDISPDGKRFLMIKQPTQAAATSTAVAARPRINIVVNWFEELKQRVPVK